MTHICYTHDELATGIERTGLPPLINCEEIYLAIVTASGYVLREGGREGGREGEREGGGGGREGGREVEGECY